MRAFQSMASGTLSSSRKAVAEENSFDFGGAGGERASV